MNHQPFRDWLLSDQALTDNQAQALQEHLQDCEACRQVEVSWKEIELAIRKAPQVSPMPGFTLRWQSSLEQYQARRQARQGWFTIAATSVVVTVLFILLAAQIWSLIQAPDAFIASWLNRLVSVISIYYLLQDFISSSSWSLPVVSFIGMIFLVGIISFMSVLWLATYRKFSLARRAV